MGPDSWLESRKLYLVDVPPYVQLKSVSALENGHILIVTEEKDVILYDLKNMYVYCFSVEWN